MVATKKTGPPRLETAQQDIRCDHKRRGPARTADWHSKLINEFTFLRKIKPRTGPWRSYSCIGQMFINNLSFWGLKNQPYI